MTWLTDEEFHAWCYRNNIEPETATYIQRLRTAPLERIKDGVYSVHPTFW